MRKPPAQEVNRPILQVGFQPFCEIPHCLLRKEVGRSTPETDTYFPFDVLFQQ
jgi:hypothetical protein